MMMDGGEGVVHGTCIFNIYCSLIAFAAPRERQTQLISRPERCTLNSSAQANACISESQ